MKILLYPLSWLYRIVVSVRNTLYDINILKSREFEVPVISVGNITVGGTGKTPHVEYLAGLLQEKFEIAILSRGYKRKTSGFRFVETTSTAIETGDEPLQIKSHFPELTVSVCENRVTGIETLVNQENKITPDVIILDDAFQHRRIVPGINILLIDYNRPVAEDTLLPAGLLRESVSQMRRANIIIITKCPDEVTPIRRRILQKEVDLKPYQQLYFTALDYDNPTPVFSAKNLDPNDLSAKKYSILALSGIASPEIFQNYLKQFSPKMQKVEFADHHYFTHNDIESVMEKFDAISADKKIIVTTEKDIMRLKSMENLPEAFRNVLYSLPVKVKFLDNEGKEFNSKILNYVGENKSNRELHKRKNKRNT